MTAESYDSLGQDVAGYQGQVLSRQQPDVPEPFAKQLDVLRRLRLRDDGPDARPLRAQQRQLQFDGPDRTHLARRRLVAPGDHTLTSATASLQVSYNTIYGAPPTEVCLVQQTSATAYDLNGNVTATTDALGHVAASSYNALGQAVAGYQGQALSTSGNSWTFNNLTPNSQSSYDVYVYSTTLLTGNWQQAYAVPAGTSAPSDATKPSLGRQLVLLGNGNGLGVHVGGGRSRRRRIGLSRAADLGYGL